MTTNGVSRVTDARPSLDSIHAALIDEESALHLLETAVTALLRAATVGHVVSGDDADTLFAISNQAGRIRSRLAALSLVTANAVLNCELVPNAFERQRLLAEMNAPDSSAICPGCGATKEANGEREHEAGCEWFERLPANGIGMGASKALRRAAE